MKKFVLSLIVGGLVLAGSAGPAVAETTNQTFTVVKVGANPGTVVGIGVINGVGVENNNRLQVLPGSEFNATFSFAEGDLLQRATPVSAQSQFDPATCVTRTAIFNTFVITDGTRGFAGVSGHGSGTADVTVVAGRDSEGRCLGPASPPLFVISVVRLTAVVDLG